MSAPAIISSGTASGGPPVGGTGTTNTIPRWTGPSTLGDSAITDNGTVIAFGRNINATSTIGGASYVLTPSAGGQVFGQTVASSVWYLGRTTGAGAAVQTDVCINNSGNVGIGTASPASRLDVAGTITCDDAGTGLKLPATPDNPDPQTLDCYEENTWTPTRAGFGGTNPTVTASYTRVGRLVTITVRMVATGGAQYSGTSPTTTLSLPATITPAANTTASSIMVYGDTTTVGTVTAWNDGLIYLPTFALTTQQTAFSITYRV